MKKLPTSCAVVVCLAVLAYQADATIVTLTKGTGAPATTSGCPSWRSHAATGLYSYEMIDLT